MLMPFGYFCTGILTTTLAQFLVYEGAGNQTSGLVVLFTFVGVVCAAAGSGKPRLLPHVLRVVLLRCWLP